VGFIVSAHGSFPFTDGHDCFRQALFLKLKKKKKTAVLKEFNFNILKITSCFCGIKQIQPKCQEKRSCFREIALIIRSFK
jgi:hypothetical protein